ncbi:MAG: metal ABC transporter permease [Bacteroidales bacterium]|nr:metal ABC transporter permease [Bacteroidales bacterium]
MIQFLIVPLLASIILLIITSYFGIHVLKREIIFIDIALAQVAALGSVFAVFLEHQLDLHEVTAGSFPLSEIITYLASLVFCLIAALIFTYLKNPKIKVPIEAFIGIAYALATTAAVIILDKGTGGDVHVHDMLTGAILWTTWPQLIRLAIIVAIIGMFHIIYRKKFISLSEDYLKEQKPLSQIKKWDFLFYFSFSIVIIEAIHIGGILTIFAFLILPASISALFSKRWDQRIFYGLMSGIIATFLGLYFSWTFDISCSPLIILNLGVILVLTIVIKGILNRKPNYAS